MPKKTTLPLPTSFQDLDFSRAQFAPVEPAPTTADAAQPSGLMRRVLGDGGISLLKGAIGVPEAAVGLADLVSGGAAGKLAEDAGFRPEQARAILDEYLSPEQKAANAEVAQAEGFMGKMGAALRNPSTVAHSVAESAPSMLAGGAVSRGLTAVAPRIPGLLAAGAGEGVVTAGQQAEQIRQGTQDGRLTGDQSALAAGSGFLTGALSGLSGKVANRLGIGDIDQFVAGVRQSGDKAAAKGLVRTTLEGAVSEGLLEELPQSVQEQMAVNIALGKPLDEGVDQAAVMGLLSGGAMGAGMAPFGRHGATAGDSIRREKLPEAGPLSRAVNAGIDQVASDVDRGAIPWQDPGQPAAAGQAEADWSTAPGAAPELPDGAVPYEPTAVIDTGALKMGDPIEVAQRNVARASASHAPVSWDVANKLASAGRARGHDFVPVEHAAGSGFTVVPRKWVTGSMVQGAARKAQADAKAAQAMGRADELSMVAPTPGSVPTPDVEEVPIVPTGDALELEHIPVGDVAEMIPTADAVEVPQEIPSGDVQEISPEVIDGDILAPSGKPFASQLQATRKAKQTGNGAKAVPVKGGFVVRTQQQEATSPGSEGVENAGLESGVARPDEPKRNDGVPGELRSGPGRAGDGRELPVGGEVRPSAAPAEAGRGSNDDALSQRWNALTAQARLPIITAAGWDAKGKKAAHLQAAAWDKVSPAHQAKLAAFMKEQAADVQDAPQEPTGVAAAAPEAQAQPQAPRAQAPEAPGTDARAGQDGRSDGLGAGADLQAGVVKSKKKEFTYQIKPVGDKFIIESDDGGGVVMAGRPNGPGALNTVPPRQFKSAEDARAFMATKGMKEHQAAPKPTDINAINDERRERGDDVVAAEAGISPAEVEDFYYGTNKTGINPSGWGQDGLNMEIQRRRKASAPSPAPTDEFDAEMQGYENNTRRIAELARKIKTLRAEISGLRGGLPDRALGSETREQLFRLRGQLSNAEKTISGLRSQAAKEATDTPKTSGADLLKDRIKQSGEARRKAESDGSTAYQSGHDRRPPDELSTPSHREAWLKGYDSAAPKLKHEEPAPAPATAPAADILDDELMSALDHLGDVLGDVLNLQMKITGKQHSAADLLPALSKVVELLIAKGFKSFAQAVTKSAQVMRTNAKTAPFVDEITPRQWKAAYNAIAESYDGTDSEEALAALSADDVKAMVGASRQKVEAESGPTGAAVPAENQAQEVADDEHSTVQGPGAQALGEVAPRKDGGAEGQGAVGASPAGRSGQRAGEDARTAAAGVPTSRSGGGRKGRVHPAEAGAGSGDDTRGTTGRRGQGKRVPGGDEGRDQRELTPSAPNIPAANFQITEEVRLGKGGEAEKFRDNVSAIRVLKTLEREQRRATPDEQRTLARYVGWGGLANAFADDEGKHKPDWKQRGEELADLLTPAELRAARRTTRNAHYTSEAIVKGMWDAVRRLGYRGGLALESSMGTGNFVGLMPDDVGQGTKFIGVEYDSLTARIAGALYPQATVLHSGLQKVPLPEGEFDLNIGNPPFGSESLRFQFKPDINGLSIHNQFFLAGLDALKPGGVQALVVSRYLLDAKDTAARRKLFGKAKLLGAIRLPDTAFKENARTEVVTDILFLQRRTKEDEQDATDAIGYLERPLTPGQLLKTMDEAGRQRYNRITSQFQKEAGEWVGTAELADPLGGEAMTVSSYFKAHPEMVLGSLERSSSMRYENDITVRLDKGADLAAMLAKAVQSLPENVMQQAPDVATVAAERHKTMSDGLKNAIAGLEPGSMVMEAGRLQQVVERETPSGDYELSRRDLSPESPWSNSLLMDHQGRWYRLIVKTDESGKTVKNGRLNVYEREEFATDADVPEGLRLGKSAYERLLGMVALRDTLKRQLTLEADNAPAKEMEANRADLRAAYADFTKRHGFINERSNAALVSEMPDGALVLALEMSFRPEITPAQAKKQGEKARPASAEPAPILQRRVVEPYTPPGTAETPADALAITLAERGVVDMERIASLLSLTEEQAAEKLAAGDKPLVFRDPETKNWETRDAYLSGQVKRKLAAAKAAGLEANVKALESVQPDPWGAESVTAILGSTWVPTDVYAEFVTHLTGGKAHVTFSRLTNSFGVSVSGKTAKAAEWSSEGMAVEELLSAIMNSSPVRVTYMDADRKIHTDTEKTALAQIKAKQIMSEFSDWVYADGERRRRLVDLFNEKFNTRVSRQFDGSHLILPGKTPDSVIELRRHQKNAVWRGISQRFNLLDHVVGAGKTFTAIARVMERRRMGLSRKPAIVVPNHMVEQFTADVYRLYPGAKVLAAGKKDFERSRRRRLFAKIATGDWDVVVIPHSSFGYIGISPETEERYLEKELELAKQAIKDAEEAAEEMGMSGPRKPFNVKEAERLAEKIETRMDALKKSNRDKLLTFEQMGIDDLTVDEAHEFKNLFYSSRLVNVRGMNDKTGSQKAFDLYNKVRVLNEQGGTVTFMTGTPISNSAVEMFTMMRYLAADDLREMGLEHFDAWRAQFVDIGTKFEPTESGRLKEVNRLGRTWSNMRNLMDLYYSFTDAVSIDDIKRWYMEDHGKDFPVPNVKGGGRQSVVVKPTPAQVDVLNEVLSGFDGLDGIKDPYERNAARLRLMDRARKVSLDVRAANPGSNSKEEGGKLDRVADEVTRIYKQWSADRGTQLIFLDRSVPKAKGDDTKIKAYDKLMADRAEAVAKSDEAAYRRVNEALEAYDANEMESLRAAAAGGWNAYQQIKDNLIARGIPSGEIRFIQEASTDAQKQALFDAVNSGEVRVLIGSTPRMGAGTNVQKRLVGLHHVDVTWKPSDIEQREGRIIRQGNGLLEKYGKGFDVEILAYATERTADAKMWDLNSTKLKTINGIRNYSGQFSMDFEDEDSVSMAELAALASGDPKLLERVKLMSEIDRLELEERAHRRRLMGFKDRIDSAERDLRTLPGRIERGKKLAQELKERTAVLEQEADTRKVDIDGAAFTNRMEAEREARRLMEEQQAGDKAAKFSLKIDGRRRTSESGMLEGLDEAFGDAKPFVWKSADGAVTHGRRTLAARDLADAATKMLGDMQSGGTKTQAVGSLLGYTVEMDVSKSRYGSGFDIELTAVDADGRTVADGRAETENGMVATQTMRGALDRMESDLYSKATFNPRFYEHRLAEADAELPDLREKVQAKFPKEGEIAQKRARLEDLVRELSAENPGRAADTPNFARNPLIPDTQASGAGMKAADVRALVEPIVKGWKHGPAGVTVVQRPEDLPPRQRAEVQAYGADGVKGMLTPDRHVYLVASNIASADEALYVLFHEVYGHFGLQSILGDEYATTMRHLARVNDSLGIQADYWMLRHGHDDVKAWIKRGMPEMKAQRRARLVSVEEALAERAGMNEPIAGWKFLVARIQRGLRAIGLGKVADWMERHTDAEVADLLFRARSFVRDGKGEFRSGNVDTSFSREQSDSQAMPKTIDVDGTQRPTTNSKGQPIHPTEEGVRNFWRWFGDSKVVDAEGRPLVVYHGTGGDFYEFDVERIGENYEKGDERGFFFTSNPDEADWAADRGADVSGGAANIMPAYLQLEDPLIVNVPASAEARGFGDPSSYFDNRTDKILQAADDGDHDGVIITNNTRGYSTHIAFRPEQIKSATGNSGAFSADSPSIVFSRDTPLDKLRTLDRQGIRNALADAMGNAGARVTWWDKTIGTQLNKAERFPEFGKVFNHVQQYVDDVSRLANESADKAPTILPKLEHLADLKKALRISEQDARAVAAPIFEGTLNWTRDDDGNLVESNDVATAGVVFTADELRKRFGLTPAQAKVYAEFRAAVDASLDQAVAADVLRLMDGTPVAFKAAAMADRVTFRRMVEQFLADQVKAQPNSQKVADLAAEVAGKFARIDGLKARGYAPLMRFGKFAVNVTGQGGESLFFGLYESRAAANRAARALADEFNGEGTVSQGVLSEEQFKLFADIPLESMEMFAQAIGAEKSEVYQEYLKLAKANRSALKRLIHRKGTAGFSDDVTRVLAAFVTSSARLSAGSMNLPAAHAVAEKIRAGDVKDEAIRLIEAVTNPQDKGGAARGLLFANFIGGSVASAVVNLTQPITMTAPYLSQWGGMAKAAKRLTGSIAQAAGRAPADKALADALKRAEDEGIVSPQEIHHLMSEATGSFSAGPAVKKLAFIWGGPFALAEKFNRRVTFIAAYKTAKEEGLPDAFAFAERAVMETQGLYNSGNKANWARNPVGAAVLTFKQFSTHYLEWMTRMYRSGPQGKRAVLWALALLALAGGADGLPFAEDVNDLADTLAQALGLDWSAKRTKREFIATTLGLGDDAADVLLHGLSAVPGVPMDLSARMSMGNLAPGTGYFLRSTTDKSGAVLEVAGAAGGLAKQYLGAVDAGLKGDAMGAAKAVLPVALQNLLKGAAMGATGIYTDTRGRKVMDVDMVDAVMKASGFQPQAVARESRILGMEQRRVSLVKATEAEIAEAWARAQADGDSAGAQKARQRLAEWNRTNPQSRITINGAQIARRVREIKASRADRAVKSAPKGMRQDMREALA